jgi:Rha family phage regulatory protein
MKTQLKIPLDAASKIIHIDHGEPWTTSLVIAAEFGLPHKNVLRAIDGLVEDGTIDRLNFEPISYTDEMNREQRAYRLNERAALTSMPFIGGRKSREGQKRLVDGFLAMRKELTRLTIQKQDAFWQQKRTEGKVARLALTDAVQDFVEYAHAQGSSNARMYYQNITKMEYRALFLIGKAIGDHFRDTLTAIQNSYLTTAESLAQRALREGMAGTLHYKEIYALAKERVEQFAAMLGKSRPGDGETRIEDKSA